MRRSKKTVAHVDFPGAVEQPQSQPITLKRSYAAIKRDIEAAVERAVSQADRERKLNPNSNHGASTVVAWLLNNTTAALLSEWAEMSWSRDATLRVNYRMMTAKRDARQKQLTFDFHRPELREKVAKLPVRFHNPETELAKLDAFVETKVAQYQERAERDPAVIAARAILAAWKARPGNVRRSKFMTIGDLDAL